MEINEVGCGCRDPRSAFTRLAVKCEKILSGKSSMTKLAHERLLAEMNPEKYDKVGESCEIEGNCS